MSIKTEKLIILGKSGSGKDFLTKRLIEKGLKPCLKWTTRPIRLGEKQGVTYNYVTEKVFLDSISNNDFITYQKFNVKPFDSKTQTYYYYGITKECFNASQVFIMTPGEYNSIKLTKDQRKGCFVVYLDIDRPTRESRLHNREDKNDSIKRRLDADEIDFKDFSDYDLKVTDPDFTAEDIWDLMC
jgi:guanylate kinase